MNTFVLGLVVIIGSVFVARNILNKANQHLSVEEISSLQEIWGRTNKLNNILIVVFIVGYFLVAKFSMLDQRTLSFGFFTMVVLFVLGKGIIDYRRMKKADFPKEYLTQYAGTIGVRLTGLLAYIFFFS